MHADPHPKKGGQALFIRQLNYTKAKQVYQVNQASFGAFSSSQEVDMRHAAYCGTRNVYGDMETAAKSLVVTRNLDYQRFGSSVTTEAVMGVW